MRSVGDGGGAASSGGGNDLSRPLMSDVQPERGGLAPAVSSINSPDGEDRGAVQSAALVTVDIDESRQAGAMTRGDDEGANTMV